MNTSAPHAKILATVRRQPRAFEAASANALMLWISPSAVLGLAGPPQPSTLRSAIASGSSGSTRKGSPSSSRSWVSGCTLTGSTQSAPTRYRPSMAEKPHRELEVGARTVRISNPDRVYFPLGGQTKLDLANYYLAVGPGIVRALRERPCMLHRFPDGTAGERIYQKRLPKGAPDWVESVEVRFPSGRTADELCVTELASVIWAVQMSTVEFHPWHSRRADTERPDELRIDLDPQPGTGLP